MYHYLLDRHPGRCLNYRGAMAGSQPVTVRCLRMEGHSEACRFEEPLVLGTMGGQAYTQPKPEPWVEGGRMSDTPERVWVSPLGVFDVEMGGSIAYVPESRALAAEAERDAALGHWQDERAVVAEAWKQLDALRADLRALVEAVNWACGCEGSDFGDVEVNAPPGRYWWRPELIRRAGLQWDRDTLRFATPRAILARLTEGREG